MIGINLKFEKGVPLPRSRVGKKQRPASVKDLICLWIETEAEVGDSFKLQGNKLRNNVMQHFNARYRPTDEGYVHVLSYRTLNAEEEIYRVWIVEKFRANRKANGGWDFFTKHEHKKLASSR